MSPCSRSSLPVCWMGCWEESCMRCVKESHHPAQTRNQTHIQELINNQSALSFLLIKKATSVRRVRPNSGASRSSWAPPSHMTIGDRFDIGHVVHVNWREDGRSAYSGPSGRSHQNELGPKNRIVPEFFPAVGFFRLYKSTSSSDH